MFNPIINRMFKGSKSYLFALLCLLLLVPVFNANTAKANMRNFALTNPTSVQLTRAEARINIEEQAAIINQNNQTSISFAIPLHAQNLTINIDGASIAQWSSGNGELDRLDGKISKEYANLISRKTKLEGQMHAVQASLDLWTTPPDSTLSINDLNKRQNALRMAVPDLEEEYIRTKELRDRINEQLKGFPKISHEIKIINVIVPANLASAQTVKVSYSYSLNNCGWRPQYQFNALPEKNTVEVSLFANIWQYSGLDWKDAEITLLPLSSQNIRPEHLSPWYVSEQKDEKVYAKRMSAQPMMLNNAFVESSADGDTAMNAPIVQHGIAFTSWNLDKRNIEEGRVEIRLNETCFNSKMLWLARPSTSSNVWLTVKHKLSNPGSWPAGNTALFIDNVLIGNGVFYPVGDEITIYFGVDPRLHVKSVANMLISGKEGFIDRSKTWDWAWKYTVYNGRKSPAQVRVEEPQPQLGNKEFEVHYTGKPKPQIGQEHTLFWNITVPAEQSITINHAVTISTPSELNINLGR